MFRLAHSDRDSDETACISFNRPITENLSRRVCGRISVYGIDRVAGIRKGMPDTVPHFHAFLSSGAARIARTES